VKGKFILSLNDTPGVRETFANFRIEAVKTRYSVSGTKKQEAAEVLITNFKLSTGGR
jgi:DNA adenine methylase